MTGMNIDNIRITANSCKVDFKQARLLAEQAILGMVRAPRLIAWRDGKKEKRQPLVQDKPDLGLQPSHDTRVRVDVNDNEYSFIFTETE